ncbi:MAG: HIT domain-containing protein [Pseudomonadota bacterium]
MTDSRDFTLDTRLEGDSDPICRLSLCELRLMNDSRYPWLLLIPRQPDLKEIIDLSTEHRKQLYQELDRCCEALQKATRAHKLNVAALGNLVPQLHVHIIARFESDAAWPGPVWGVGNAQPYDEPLRDERIRAMQVLLN